MVMSRPCLIQQLISPTLSTQHFPVPLVYFGNRKLNFLDGGSLADIAPTMLALLDLPQPEEMTGQSLIIY